MAKKSVKSDRQAVIDEIGPEVEGLDATDQRLIDQAKASALAPDFDKDAFCKIVFGDFSNPDMDKPGFSDLLSSYGAPSDITNAVDDADAWLKDFSLFCFVPNYPKPDLVPDVQHQQGFRRRLLWIKSTSVTHNMEYTAE